MSAAGPLTAHRPERVAVVIPAKNEAERIEATIVAAREIQGVDLVVVVDDGSTDATSAVAMGADALVVRHKTNRGKAAAMATGAQMVAIREDAERADGGAGFSEELHAEPRSPGHTGPLPVIDGKDRTPRALLFVDADMESSVTTAQPLVDAVLGEGVDMAIALLPPQAGAGGMGIVVGTARRGILRATGWEATQPLSGTRCITRETWEACQPLAPGWGVETSLTIDALTGGFWVKEIETSLAHRATGKDLRGQLHRAAQLRDVVRALARRRHVLPDEPADDPTDEPAVLAAGTTGEFIGEPVIDSSGAEPAGTEPAEVEPAEVEPAEVEPSGGAATAAVTPESSVDPERSVTPEPIPAPEVNSESEPSGEPEPGVEPEPDRGTRAEAVEPRRHRPAAPHVRAGRLAGGEAGTGTGIRRRGQRLGPRSGGGGRPGGAERSRLGDDSWPGVQTGPGGESGPRRARAVDMDLTAVPDLVDTHDLGPDLAVDPGCRTGCSCDVAHGSGVCSDHGAGFRRQQGGSPPGAPRRAPGQRRLLRRGDPGARRSRHRVAGPPAAGSTGRRGVRPG